MQYFASSKAYAIYFRSTFALDVDSRVFSTGKELICDVILLQKRILYNNDLLNFPPAS